MAILGLRGVTEHAFEEKPTATELRRLMPFVREFQRLAETEGIADIFQDNGGKLVQLLIILGLENIPARERNDARDSTGREYELKGLNRRLVKDFSTITTSTQRSSPTYRQVDWIFAVYNNIDLKEVYLLQAEQLEPIFTFWEAT